MKRRRSKDSRAQLANQTAALTDVSTAFVTCNDGLAELLSDVLNQDYVSAQAIVGQTSSNCQYAEDALASYQSNYPG
jgi:hypothetical protein